MVTFADSSGPTGAPGHGIIGVSSISAFSFWFVSASWSLRSLIWASSSA